MRLLLIDNPASGARNMALDAALLQAAANGVFALRLYSWDRATLSFGRNEPALRRYDRAAIEREGVAVVRRPTGGRAVWHDREVTYSVAAPEAAFGSLRDAYREIHAMLAEALRALGAAVALAGDRPAAGVGAGACFASAAGGEVLAQAGGKIVGSAQVREGGALLQHGSILLEAEQHHVAALTRGVASPDAGVGLAELLGGAGAGWARVTAAIAATAAVRWRLPDTPTALPEEIATASERALMRFNDPAWTWRR